MIGTSGMLAACLPTEMKSLALSPPVTLKGADKLCLAKEAENIPPGVLVNLKLLWPDIYQK